MAGVGGLYQTADYAARAMQGMGAAGQTLAGIKAGSKTTIEEGRTAGGAIGAIAGGAIAGAEIPIPGITGLVGAGIGAGVGLLSYFF